MGLFINCDHMVDEQFEKGLRDLNLVVGHAITA